MFVSHLSCPKCRATYEPNRKIQLCTCGSPLLVAYDLKKTEKALKKDSLPQRRNDLWRYRELLPVRDFKNIVTLGEGMTPLIRLRNIGGEMDLPHLYLKDEGIIPTGTFKARGAAVGVSMAKELGVKALAMPTNGNAGGAWALYCAAAGIQAVIVMPKDAPPIPRKECVIAGASLYLVNGLISDAGRIVGRAVTDRGLYDASTLKEPYRIEGKKTMGLEIAEQFGWDVPEVILYPTGGGVGIIGIYKALQELQEIGWIGSRMPRLVAVQASGCAPVVSAWQAKKTESVFWENSATVAFGINVPKALGDFLVLDAVYATNGCAVAVTDEDILNAQAYLGRREGLFVCPEGAATLAAARRLVREGWIEKNERVVLLNTGTGLKYPDSVDAEPPVLQPGDAIER
ncbi:MAG: threonine synthase [Syntrophales bacterium]|jgi:threonine synthase|nr:threonine synthase [Syntrophales bacterium]HOG06725.1 threonine synthase [Syntrophales bacterium]HOS78100.1 threonine synthase [Syntrophales bacterium]HPB71327.1 threonine synthase [Syntrophales bacterium]HQN26247.1 threonine synthase [Syntrophales bacterium]